MIINKKSFEENIKREVLGIYSGSPEVLRERMELIRYYDFYEGDGYDKDSLSHPLLTGQSWLTPELRREMNLDYDPSVVIRNHTKKLIDKQAGYMMSLPPTITIEPYDEENTDSAQDAQQFIEDILDETEFWNKTYKAFLDSTISKRVLMVVKGGPEHKLQFNYYTADQFTYKLDPYDANKLSEAVIAYQDADTADETAEKQIWHRWKYYMDYSDIDRLEGQEDSTISEGKTCWLVSGTYDGNGKPLQEKTVDTKIKEIPARVILNGGLTGDTEGTSDIKSLMNAAMDYNKTMSDLKDAIRFGMFEQPVFKDASAASVESARIAPNALIDLKTDPAAPEGTTASLDMLSSPFHFKGVLEYYLDRTIADMYEIMDQPRPDDIKNIPSGKAFRYTFHDLTTRCGLKWISWAPAIRWALQLAIELIEQFKIDVTTTKEVANLDGFKINITPNYPVPEDEDLKKEMAIKEVEAGVLSIRTYMRDYTDVQDENAEFQAILEEKEMLQAANQDPFTAQMMKVDSGEEVNKEPLEKPEPKEPEDKSPDGKKEE